MARRAGGGQPQLVLGLATIAAISGIAARR